MVLPDVLKPPSLCENGSDVWVQSQAVLQRPTPSACTVLKHLLSKLELNQLKQGQLFSLGVTTVQLARSELDLGTSSQALCGRSCPSFSVCCLSSKQKHAGETLLLSIFSRIVTRIQLTFWRHQLKLPSPDQGGKLAVAYTMLTLLYS